MSEIRMDSAFKLALPFWCSLLLVPLLWITAIWGGWSFLIVIFATWILFSILDAAFGLYPVNEDPETDKSLLYWHRMITLIWAPLQF
ncbi:MAG: alkane 1-monooxygenase, partial [Paracoccaceae bacterium]